MFQGEMTLPPDLLARTQTALQGRDVVWGHREVFILEENRSLLALGPQSGTRASEISAMWGETF